MVEPGTIARGRPEAHLQESNPLRSRFQILPSRCLGPDALLGLDHWRCRDNIYFVLSQMQKARLVQKQFSGIVAAAKVGPEWLRIFRQIVTDGKRGYILSPQQSAQYSALRIVQRWLKRWPEGAQFPAGMHVRLRIP